MQMTNYHKDGLLLTPARGLSGRPWAQSPVAPRFNLYRRAYSLIKLAAHSSQASCFSPEWSFIS